MAIRTIVLTNTKGKGKLDNHTCYIQTNSNSGSCCLLVTMACESQDLMF